MSQNDPEVEEEETEEQKKKTGRSVFIAGLHKGEGDTFSGSFRGVPAIPHGGTVTVKHEDVIGNPDCWCGQVYGHDWPGKRQGAPHPRGDEVSAIADEKPYINPRDLKAYDRKVVRAVCALVNEHGVHYRFSGTNVILIASDTCGDDIAERIKVSPARQPENQVKFLEAWAKKYIRPAKVEEAAKVLAEKFNDPAKKVHEKPVLDSLQETTRRRSEAASAAHERRRTAPTPTPPPKEPAMPVSAPSAPTLEFKGDAQEDGLDDLMDDTPPEGFERHYNQDGSESKFFKKIGADQWKCKDCDYLCTTVQQFSGHRRVHNQGMFSRKRFIALLTRAASEVGIDLADYEMHVDAHRVVKSTKGVDTAPLTKEVDRLTKELAKVTTERDNLQAWKDLILEASK